MERSDGSPRILRLTGRLTIERAAEARELFLQCLDDENGLEVDMTGVENVDLSFIQLLYALIKETERRKKVFSLTGRLNDKVQRVFQVTECITNVMNSR